MKQTDFDTSRAISPGMHMANYCEICGKLKRAKDHNSDRCSKIKQRVFAELRAKAAKTDGE